jgi:outer membrane receptor protein involved in Fe transport
VNPHSPRRARVSECSSRFELNHTRIEPQFNIFNLTNANDVVSLTTRYGPSWQNVTGVLPPRMVKLGIQVDF